MAGSQVSKSVAIDWFINAVYGYEAVTIDEYATTASPEVQAGSKIEINGDLYKFTSAEAITGWSGISNSTQAYIKFVPSGSSVTVAYTSTAPTWSDSKQGWYGTGGTANDRYIFAVYKDGSGNYTKKSYLPKKSNRRLYDDMYIDGGTRVTGTLTVDSTTVLNNNTTIDGALEVQNTVTIDSPYGLKFGLSGTASASAYKYYVLGDWNMDSTAILNVAHGLGSTNWKFIQHITAIIRDDADTTYYHFASGGNPTTAVGITVNSTNIVLTRPAGGTFDSTSFDSTSYNRGYLHLWISV